MFSNLNSISSTSILDKVLFSELIIDIVLLKLILPLFDKIRLLSEILLRLILESVTQLYLNHEDSM